MAPAVKYGQIIEYIPGKYPRFRIAILQSGLLWQLPCILAQWAMDIFHDTPDKLLCDTAGLATAKVFADSCNVVGLNCS